MSGRLSFPHQFIDADGGYLDSAGKVWRANAANGCGGHNHVDVLWNRCKSSD